MSTPPPVPQKKGMSGLAIAGIGCLGLVVIAFLGGGVLVARFMPKLKEIAGDFEKDPAKAATMLALKMNPDVEVIKTDDTKREVTFKTKSSGETTTISFDDFEKGKITVKNDKGEEYSVDASKAQTEGVVMKGPEGQTIVGGSTAASAPPDGVPLYPGLQLGKNGFRTDAADSITGLTMGEVSDSVAQVQEYYENALKTAGYEVTTTIQAEGKMAVIAGQKDGGKSNISLTLSASEDAPEKTAIQIQYRLPKP